MKTVVSLLVAMTACSQASTPAATRGEARAAAPAEPATEPHGRVIATMVTHDARVDVLGSGRGELLVAVRGLGPSGHEEIVTLDELRASHPTVYALVTSALAGTPGGPSLDARLDLPLREMRR